MASYSDIAHRWANQDFGRNGSLVAGNCSCDEYSFKSYNTVIGQWLDKDKNVMVIIDENLSPSTSKHISALCGAVPGRVHVFRCHLSATYWEWDNVHFIDRHTPFDKKVRMQMVEVFINNLYLDFLQITTSRSLKDGEISFKCWRYIKELNELYNHDASPQKWLKQKLGTKLTKESRALIMRKRKMVRSLLEGLSIQEVTDAVFGAGTWDAYEERVAPLKKAANAREFAEKVNKYLMTSNGWSRKPLYSYKEIQAMTPSQRIAIKFANFEKKLVRTKKQREHKEKSMERAMRYIGLGPIKDSRYDHTFQTVTNHFTGEVIYFMEHSSYYYNYHEHIEVKFGPEQFREFCNAPDKKHWLKRFYDMCAIKRSRIVAMNVDHDIKSGKRTVDSLTPVETALYDAYRERCAKYERDAELRRIKEAEEREARMAELEARKRAEREEKLQKLAVYRESGIEGLRNIWRDHLDAIPNECRDDKEYYYGGNILLRFKDDTLIETSKGIRLPVKVCKVVFRTIKQWHEDPRTFTPTEIRTENCGIFRITEYRDDILVAGCHRIAYTEMERMYNEILKLQQVA